MKTYFIYIIAGMLVLGLTAGDALARTKQEKPRQSTPALKKADPKKTQEQLVRKRKELEGSSWSVTLKLAEKAAASADTLKFQDGRFSSVGFQAVGFSPTNYTLSMADSGIIVFETMQTSEKEGTIFWRGELLPDGTTCQGMFSHVLADKRIEDTYFTGKKITEKPEGA